MNWQDYGIILGINNTNDNFSIASILTKNHGCHKGAISSKLSFSQGNFVTCQWQARLSEHMGRFKLEEIKSIKDHSCDNIIFVASLFSLLSILLPERQNCEDVFLSVTNFLYPKIKLNYEERLRFYWTCENQIIQFLGTKISWQFCGICSTKNNLCFFDKFEFTINCKDHKPKHNIYFSPKENMKLSLTKRALKWLELNDLILNNYLDIKEKKPPIEKILLMQYLKKKCL